MAKKITVYPIYVLVGKESALVKKQYHQLLEKLLAPDQRNMGLLTVDSQTSIEQVLDELRTAPFLTDRRVVAVPDADKFISQHRAVLEKYFDNPCSWGVLILMPKSFPGTTKLAKKLKSVGKLINLAPPKPWQMPAHLSKYVKETFNKNFPSNAAQLLVELTGDDMGRLYSEVDKLVVYVDERKSITVADIESLVGHNRIFGVFEVIDSVISGNIGQALERLRNMFAQDKNAQYTVVGAFAFHFRKMFNAKALLSQGKSVFDVTKELRIWGKKDQFFAQVHKVPLDNIGRQLQKLAEIDFGIKTGQTRAQVAIEQLVLSMVQ